MAIKERDLKCYRSIYLSTYGEDIPKEIAVIQAQALINLIKYSLSPETFDYGD